MIKYAKIIGLSVIIGVLYFATPGRMIKELSYAAPPAGGGSPAALSPIQGEERETDIKRTPPVPGLIYLPIDLGDRRCRMAKIADGFAGYMDIDGDDVEENIRIAKRDDGILLRGSFEQRFGILGKNGIDASSLAPGDPVISTKPFSTDRTEPG